VKRVFDPQLCQHSFASRYNPDFSESQTGCSYKLAISSRPLLAGLVLFQSFANDKDEIFFTSAMKIHISLSARLVKHLQHQPNQSKSNLSRQAPLSQQEADEKVIPQCIHSLVTPQQTGSNPLVILRCCSVGYSTMHSFSKLHRGWEWKSSLTHYPTTTTNKYPLVRSVA
jgi:hypothetical protein